MAGRTARAEDRRLPGTEVGRTGQLVSSSSNAGQFIVVEFATDPTVVYVEDKTTGLFLDDPDKVAIYKLTAEKLTDLALD